VREYLEILWTFMRVGAMTFGGGYAMIPVVERELVNRKGWASMDEVMDYYTIAQITPGIIAVNLSTFIGYKRKGPLGGVLGTIGFLIPGLVCMIIISLFIRRFTEYPAVQHAFTGIRVAVGALILDTVLKLLKGVFRDKRAILIFVLCLTAEVILSASPALIILGAGAAGFLLYRPAQTPPPPDGAP
jgi:chromate transporter